jgi:hypothetical protein
MVVAVADRQQQVRERTDHLMVVLVVLAVADKVIGLAATLV